MSDQPMIFFVMPAPQCDGKCVERADKALADVVVQEVEHEGDRYLNANDVERLIDTVVKATITRIAHASGAEPVRQQLIAYGVQYAANKIQAGLGSTVRGEVPDSIPEDWLTPPESES